MLFFEKARRIRDIPLLLSFEYNPELARTRSALQTAGHWTHEIITSVSIIYRTSIGDLFDSLEAAQRHHNRRRDRVIASGDKLVRGFARGAASVVDEDSVVRGCVLEHLRQVADRACFYSLAEESMTAQGLSSYLCGPRAVHASGKRRRSEAAFGLESDGIAMQSLPADPGIALAVPVGGIGDMLDVPVPGSTVFRIIKGAPAKHKLVRVAPGAGRRLSPAHVAVTLHRVAQGSTVDSFPVSSHDGVDNIAVWRCFVSPATSRHP